MSNLIDRIYEAAFVPDQWHDVLRDMALLSNSAGATVFIFNDARSARGRSTKNLCPLLAEFLASDTLLFSTGVVRMCSVQPASFVEVDSFMTADEIENDPIRIRLRALGFGAHLCTAIPMPSGELVIVVLQKRLGDGRYDSSEIDPLDRLRPHLARS